MKQKIWMVAAAFFVVAMIGAVYLYGTLTESYTPDVQPPQINNTAQQTESGASDGTNDSEKPEPIPAPDVKFTDGDGNEVKLSDFFGKPIVLNLWASWCGPCKMEMPHFEKAMAEYGDEMHFLLINVDDDAKTVKQFINDSGYSFAPYLDTNSEVSYTYGTGSIPLTYFIDADGNVVTGYLGAIPEETLNECIALIRK